MFKAGINQLRIRSHQRWGASTRRHEKHDVEMLLISSSNTASNLLEAEMPFQVFRIKEKENPIKIRSLLMF